MSAPFVFASLAVGLLLGLTFFLSYYINRSPPQSISLPIINPLPQRVKATATVLTTDTIGGAIYPLTNTAGQLTFSAQSNAVRTFTKSDPTIFLDDVPPAYLNTGVFYKPISTSNIRLSVRVRARFIFNLQVGPPVPTFALGVGNLELNGTFIARSLVQTPILVTTGSAQNYEIQTEIEFSKSYVDLMPGKILRIVPAYLLNVPPSNTEVLSVELTLIEL